MVSWFLEWQSDRCNGKTSDRKKKKCNFFNFPTDRLDQIGSWQIRHSRNQLTIALWTTADKICLLDIGVLGYSFSKVIHQFSLTLTVVSMLIQAILHFPCTCLIYNRRSIPQYPKNLGQGWKLRFFFTCPSDKCWKICPSENLTYFSHVRHKFYLSRTVGQSIISIPVGVLTNYLYYRTELPCGQRSRVKGQGQSHFSIGAEWLTMVVTYGKKSYETQVKYSLKKVIGHSSQRVLKCVGVEIWLHV